MAVDRSYRSKSSEERRTTATNSLQSRVVSRRSGHAAPLPLLPLCSLPSTCAQPRTLSFFFHLCAPVVVVRIGGRLYADETRSFYLRARTRSSTIVDALTETLLNHYTSLSFGCSYTFIYTYGFPLSRCAPIVYLRIRIFISRYVSLCEQVPRDSIHTNMPR